MPGLTRKGFLQAGVAVLAAPAILRAAGPRTMRLASIDTPDSPNQLICDRFAELVAAKSGGKIKVQEFAASQLGNELQQQAALQGGVQEMLVASTTSLTGIVKEFGLFDFPFLFTNARQADAMVDGPLGKLISGKLADKGVIILGFFDLGFRNVTNSKRPITKGEDLDGLKLRVIPNPVFLETFKTFKANPLPMPFAELYNALESKAVDGQENPYSVILSSKFYEVQKHIVLTGHIVDHLNTVVSSALWKKLSEEDRKIFTDVAQEAAAKATAEIKANEGKLVDFFKQKGLTVTEVNKDEFRDTVLKNVSFESFDYRKADWERIQAVK